MKNPAMGGLPRPPDSARTLPGVEPPSRHVDHSVPHSERETPNRGTDLRELQELRKQLEGLSPSAAVEFLALQVASFRAELVRLETIVRTAASHADRGEQVSGHARDEIAEARGQIVALDTSVRNALTAIYVLQDLPEQVRQAFELLTGLRGDVNGLIAKVGSVERTANEGKRLHGRTWQAVSQMRQEQAKLAGSVVEMMAGATEDRAARAKAEAEMVEIRRVAQEAKAEAQEAQEAIDEWEQTTGERYIDDLSSRASKGDELRDALVKQQMESAFRAQQQALQQAQASSAVVVETKRADIEVSKTWHTTAAKIVVGLFATGGLGSILFLKFCGG